MIKERVETIWIDGARFVRAHHWGKNGYSLRTCANMAQAQEFLSDKYKQNETT